MADNRTNIVITAEDRASAALAKIQSGMSGMTAGVAALGTSFAGLGAVAFVKGVIDSADSLGKLSQKIGISVEDLSGFDHAAKLSDLSTEQFAKGVKQLSKYMGENSDKLHAVGITATNAKEALIQIADSFARMPDGVQKTAIAMELMGKSGADMIPLLNGGGAALRDMIEEGQRLNPVTTEMAKNAEKFNDTLTRLKASTGTVGVAIANDLLPPLTALAERLQQSFSGGIVEGFTSRWGAVFKGMAAGINEALAASEEFLGKITFGKVAENHYRQALAYRDAAKSIYQELSALAPADAKLAPASPAGKTNLTSLLSKPTKVGKAPDAIDVFGTGSFITHDKATAAAIKESFEFENWAWGQLAADRNKATEATDKLAQKYKDMIDPLQQYRVMLDEIDRLEASGNLDATQALEARWRVQEMITKATEDTSEALKKQKSIGEELGMTFSSAFEDAIVGGKKFRDVLDGIAQDILRIITRKNVTEPLAAGISSINWSNLFSASANGNVFSGAGIGAYSGQIVSRPTVFPFASGIGLMGEAGPEAILPLTRRNGKLGVEGGGGSMVVNIIEAPGKGGQQQTRNEGGTKILDVFVERIKAAVAQDISDGRGAIPAAMSTTYGLNRGAGAW